mmetsp:Transcript_43202/g.108143  ORF Transcript_43202/g.108143 Transcript_43202/m.108143 type:complete len:96 (+) Transcript_43202:3-290(+)
MTTFSEVRTVTDEGLSRCRGYKMVFQKLFPSHFSALYPGHKKLDDYIFGGGAAATASLSQSQVQATTPSPKASVTASLKARLGPQLSGPPQGFMF